MRPPFIQITRHLYEEPYHLNLVILSSNGLASGGLEFYSNTSDIEKLGHDLSDFQAHERENHLFELGSELPKDNFAFYFRMRAYGKGKSTHADNSKTRCFIQLRLNNNEPADVSFNDPPLLTDFRIETDFENINKIGNLLVNFAKLKHQRLLWSPSEILLDDELNQNVQDNMAAALASLPN